jgi:flagellar biosynthesis protein FliQ
VSPSELVASAQQALLLSVTLALPVVAVAAAVGLVVAALQAATQIQDITIAHLPRIVAVALALAVFGPWIGQQIAVFAIHMFTGA